MNPPHSRRVMQVLALCICCGLLASSASSQTVGGDQSLLRQFDGGSENHRFGYALAGAGDVNHDGFDDILVGDYMASPGGVSEAGMAHVFSGADSSILFQFAGPYTNAHLGSAVASAGDVNADGFVDILICRDYVTQHYTYVYSGADGSLLHLWNHGTSNGGYGVSLTAAGAGDVNVDGFDDIVVGAPFTQSGVFQYAGAAMVYSGADGSLLYQFDGNRSDYYLGRSVSGAGDLNGDGFADILVSASATYAMSNDVFAYSGADGTLLFQWSSPSSHDYFGASVAAAGDVNADGAYDIIIGAPRTSAGLLGAAYVYSGADGTLLHTWSGTSTAMMLGGSVAGFGDANRDGFVDLLIGASSTTGSLAGGLFLFSGKDGSQIHQRYIWNLPGFGSAVANAGDINGDGFCDIAVNAQAHLNPPGSVFISTFIPFLGADENTLSAASGGVVNLSLDFPQAPSYSYKVLVSGLGIGPTNYGVDIPLSLDVLIYQSFTGNYPVLTSNMHGTLDANGRATASFLAPAGLSPVLVGHTYYLAAIANQPGQLPEYSSIVVPITILP